MKLFDLAGKVAIVTGGNGGIGLGVARGLAQAGADLAVVGRNQAKSARAIKELSTYGTKVIAIEADATQESAVSTMVERVASTLGGVDILVNNAGTNVRKLPQNLSVDAWHLVQNTNLTSAFLCSKACWPWMKKTGQGKVLNNGSMMSLFGAPWSPAYAASKGGIMQLTKSLACAWAPDNIQVNCFLPGWIDTSLTQKAREEINGLHDRVLARTPAARWGDIDDFQGIAVFLSSAASNFVTGAVITVDGGYSVQG